MPAAGGRRPDVASATTASGWTCASGTRSSASGETRSRMAASSSTTCASQRCVSTSGRVSRNCRSTSSRYAQAVLGGEPRAPRHVGRGAEREAPTDLHAADPWRRPAPRRSLACQGHEEDGEQRKEPRTADRGACGGMGAREARPVPGRRAPLAGHPGRVPCRPSPGRSAEASSGADPHPSWRPPGAGRREASYRVLRSSVPAGGGSRGSGRAGGGAGPRGPAVLHASAGLAADVGTIARRGPLPTAAGVGGRGRGAAREVEALATRAFLAARGRHGGLALDLRRFLERVTRSGGAPLARAGLRPHGRAPARVRPQGRAGGPLPRERVRGGRRGGVEPTLARVPPAARGAAGAPRPFAGGGRGPRAGSARRSRLPARARRRAHVARALRRGREPVRVAVRGARPARGRRSSAARRPGPLDVLPDDALADAAPLAAGPGSARRTRARPAERTSHGSPWRSAPRGPGSRRRSGWRCSSSTATDSRSGRSGRCSAWARRG